MKLEDRFNAEIKARKFTLVEMIGFGRKPKLAIKAGMAIGYKLARSEGRAVEIKGSAGTSVKGFAKGIRHD